MDQEGIEPLTSRLQVRRANHYTTGPITLQLLESDIFNLILVS